MERATPGSAMAQRWLDLLRVMAVLVVTFGPGPAGAADDATLVAPASKAASGAEVDLHFFWSPSCPHCRQARPFVQRLAETRPWLAVHSYDLSARREHVAAYVSMAAAIGERARVVPAFIFCSTMHTGFDADETTGRFLAAQLDQCRGRLRRDRDASASAATSEPAPTAFVPVLGEFDPGRYSLPVLTVILAGLDSFNPCAFFVLLFLLTLLVHARSRARILLIGGTFVLISGVIYFVFMAAWLNVFLVMGQVRAVTAVAGAVAVGLAMLNVKDYFWFKRGPSLTIPEKAKPGLFDRMRGLVSADSMSTMLLGTVALAVAANSYELLCTAGFPMVFTRVLTLSELSRASHYLYLVLYNAIYVIPLLVFVVAFAWTLGSRRLEEREGRRLKLLSGLMMMQLGVVLLVRPEAMNHLYTAVAMLGVALLASAAIWRREKSVAHRRRDWNARQLRRTPEHE